MGRYKSCNHILTSLLGLFIILAFNSCERSKEFNQGDQDTYLKVYPKSENQRSYHIQPLADGSFWAVTTEDTSFSGEVFEIVYINHFDKNGLLQKSKRLSIHTYKQGVLKTKISNGHLRVMGRFIGSRLWKFGYYELDKQGELVGGFNPLLESSFEETVIESNPNEWLFTQSAAINTQLEGNYFRRGFRIYNSDESNWNGSRWPGCYISKEDFADSISPIYGVIYDFSEAKADGDFRIYKTIGEFILPDFADNSNIQLGIFTIKQKRDDALLWSIERETEITNISLFNHWGKSPSNNALLHCWTLHNGNVYTVSGPHYKSEKTYKYPADKSRSIQSGLVIRNFDAETQQLNFQKNINIPYSVTINSVEAEPSGNIYLTGYIYNDELNTQPVIVCLNNSGDLQWVNQLNNYQIGSFNAIAEDDNGHLYITGSTNAFGVDSYDLNLLMIKCSQKDGKF